MGPWERQTKVGLIFNYSITDSNIHVRTNGLLQPQRTMNNIYLLIWFSLPLLVPCGNYQEQDEQIIWPSSIFISRSGFQRRQSKDTKDNSPGVPVLNGYHIKQHKRQYYDGEKELHKRFMNLSPNRTTPCASVIQFNASRNTSHYFNNTCNYVFGHGNSSLQIVLAPGLMDPLLRLQMSQDGRKLLASLSYMFRNLSEKDINMISSILPPGEGFIRLVHSLWASGDGKQFILRMVRNLNNITSRQISTVLNLMSSQRTSTQLSMFTYFLSDKAGHDLVNGIFGRNVSDSLLKYVSFISQLQNNTRPSIFDDIVSPGSHLNTILMDKIRHNMTFDVTRGMQNCSCKNKVNVKPPEAALGQSCEHSKCQVKHSVCCRGNDGILSCICLSGYLKAVNGTCITAPTKVLEVTVHEYWIHPNVKLGTVVATFRLLSLPGILHDLQVSVDVVPRDSGLSAVVNPSNISLVHVSSPRYKNIMIHVTASTGYTHIHQVIPVRISTLVDSKPKTVNLFVLDGTRNGTIVADIISEDFSQDYPYFNITNSYPGQIANILFTLQGGQLLLTRDVDLYLLSGDDITCSLELFFKVRAWDQRSTRSVVLANVYILIIKSSFNYFVEENLLHIPVLKNSLRPFRQPQFNVSISDLNKVFTYENGTVILKTYLDFENPHHHDLQFSVRIRTLDGLRETSISANIHVENIDDEPPVFMLPVYSFSMLKGSPRGSIVGIVKATDPDTPEQHLSYTLDEKGRQLFRIGADGAISVDVLSNLSSGFNLTASVSDGVRQSVRDSVVKVTVVTQNIPMKNLRLKFDLHIPEHSPRGIQVASLKTYATAISNYTAYHILEAQNTFKIDRNTGNISIIQDLDREAGHHVQTFTVMGVERDTTHCGLVILGTLRVVIDDINDHTPQFDSSSYDIHLLENDATAIGKVVLKVTIFDPDEGQNGISHFSLVGQNRDSFHVDTTDGKTANIRPNTTFDRETIQDFVLYLVAMDGGRNRSSGNTSSASIKVHVLDINDNAPEFDSDSGTHLTIRENADTCCLERIRATDEDSGANGNVSFTVVSGKGYFQIGQQTGVLCTTEKLDREVYGSINISLEAFDHGEPQLKSLRNFTISVLDENDNAPRFNNNLPYITRYPENKTCKSPIITISAEDADINKTVTYNLSSKFFKINSSTGDIRCKQPLDFEAQMKHTLTVFAVDSGKPVRSASTIVIVDVQDVNDNKPIFSKSVFETKFLISRWAANKPVLVLDVSDADSGKYGEITFQTHNQNLSQYFTVVGNVVRTVRPHAPSVGKYSFNVTATDGGSPPNSATAQVVIHLSTIPTSPSLLNSSRPGPVLIGYPHNEVPFTVIENRNYSTKAIGMINANVNPVQKITYTLVETSGPFILNASTGSLFYRDQFDREKKSFHQLMIRAQLTNGSDYDLALVNISVSDVNDNKPRFQTDYHQQVYWKESVAIDTVVRVVNTTDPDTGANGNVTYTLSPHADFTIGEQTGIVRVARMLDVDSGNSSVRLLLVTASDQGDPPLTSSTTLHIVLMDVNDNAPVFTKDRYTFHVKENAEVNEKVYGSIPLRAYDRDLDHSTNGHVIYNRTMVAYGEPGNCPFYVSENGDIGVNSKLDYETKRSYSCIATASDNPVYGNNMNARTFVDFYVDDVNDNAPEFKNIPYTVNISRDAAVGSVVTDAVVALDSDTAGNGVVTYSLINAYKMTFSIDASTGIITVKHPLWSLPPTVTLTVLAVDMPQFDTPLNTSANVVISIFGNPRPRFLKHRYDATVKEEAEPLNDIVQVVTTGHLHFQGNASTQGYNYTLQAGEFSDYFRIKNSNGMVSQTRPVDREVTGGMMLLYVTVSEGVSLTRRDTAVINVTVDDINDNVPVFTPAQQIQTFVTTQTTHVGHVIGRIASYDIDDPATSSAVYRPVIANRSIYVDTSGQLTVREPLVKEGVEFYTIQLMVGVSDGSILQGVSNITRLTQQNTSALIIIHVKQLQNSHAPTFTQDLYEANISSTSQHTTILIPEFNATDGDGDNITYSIVSGNVRDLFHVDRASGVLSLQYDVDSTIPPVMNLTVEAVDSGFVSKSSTCVIIIRQEGSDVRKCYSSNELNLQIQTEIKKVYPVVVGVVAGLLVAAVVVAIVLAVKLRMSRKLLSQLYCTNTVLSSTVDQNGQRMRYARSSVDRDYREARPYASIADLSEVFYIDYSSLSKTGGTQRSHTYSDADPDYESIQNDASDRYKGHL